MSRPQILVVEDEPDMRWVLSRLFRDDGFDSTEVASAREAMLALDSGTYDVMVSDVRMPDIDGITLLRHTLQHDPDLPVILVSAVEDLETAVGAMKQGAYDYVAKPFDPPRLLVAARRAAERRQLRREVARLKGQLEEQRVSFGVSSAAEDLARTIALVAPQTSLSVLIQGESGTGKEVVAREIHRQSPSASGSFVAVDCGALPEPLMESQLFGHRKGAFTGADRDHDGLFLAADGGTLFLDELGNLPLPLQTKLLRALQERTVVPVGGGAAVPFDARLLCATNADLHEVMNRGEFRVDLYHRIAEFSLKIPPIRQRPDDVLYFARRFLGAANAELARQVDEFSPEAERALLQHGWPGNLRELRNAIRRAVLLASGNRIDAGDLALQAPVAAAEVGVTGGGDPGLPLGERIRRASETLESEILVQTLAAMGGNKAATARALQIDYTTLHRKLRRYGVPSGATAP